MILQAKRIEGSTYTATDKLEANFNSEGVDMSYVLHTIVVVSGGEVTHGGGAASGEYAHYKNATIDANANGVIDYSTVDIPVVQEGKGTSIIKVQCSVLSIAENEANINAYEAWENTPESDDKPESAPTPIAPTIYTSGEISLEWNDDILV